jgi:hypothetical protein
MLTPFTVTAEATALVLIWLALAFTFYSGTDFSRRQNLH